jgi:mRNA interferase MazF
MPPTTTYKRGDVVLVSFPFTDLTATKQRPALIVSPDSVNRLNQDFILAAITSQLPGDEHSVGLSEGDFQQGKLPKKSVIRITKMFTMHSMLIRKKIGTLKPAKMDEVLDRMRKIFS